MLKQLGDMTSEVANISVKKNVLRFIEKRELKKEIYKQSYQALVMSQYIIEDIVCLYIYNKGDIDYAEFMDEEKITRCLTSDFEFGIGMHSKSRNLKEIINIDSVESLKCFVSDEEVKKYSKYFIDSDEILVDWLTMLKDNLILRKPVEFIKHRDRVIKYLNNNKKYKKIISAKVSTLSEYREYFIECLHKYGKKLCLDYQDRNFYEYRWKNRNVKKHTI